MAYAAVEGKTGPWSDNVLVVNPGPAPPGYPGQAQSMLYAIPEPATVMVWSLLGMAAVGFSIWRRKRVA